MSQPNTPPRQTWPGDPEGEIERRQEKERAEHETELARRVEKTPAQKPDQE